MWSLLKIILRMEYAHHLAYRGQDPAVAVGIQGAECHTSRMSEFEVGYREYCLFARDTWCQYCADEDAPQEGNLKTPLRVDNP
jgi:hypothetical protein